MNLTKRQSEIMNVTIDLIAKGGIQNFTMKSLAEEIGISEPAIYRHYKSKLEILLAILESIREEITSFDKENGNYEIWTICEIGRMLGLQIQRFIKQPSLASIIFAEEIFQNNQQLSEAVLTIMNERCDLIETVIKSEQERGVVRKDISAHIISQIIMGTVRFMVSKWNLSGKIHDLKKEYSESWDAILAMIVI